MPKPKTINEYIAGFPPDVQETLEQFRAIVTKNAPQITEVISYGVPAFKMNGAMLVWFAAHTKHIGFYPRKSAIEAFKKELSIYKGAKGSVQFPLGNPLPVRLIAKMVKFRVEENNLRAEMKKKKTK